MISDGGIVCLFTTLFASPLHDRTLLRRCSDWGDGDVLLGRHQHLAEVGRKDTRESHAAAISRYTSPIPAKNSPQCDQRRHGVLGCPERLIVDVADDSHDHRNPCETESVSKSPTPLHDHSFHRDTPVDSQRILDEHACTSAGHGHLAEPVLLLVPFRRERQVERVQPETSDPVQSLSPCSTPQSHLPPPHLVTHFSMRGSDLSYTGAVTDIVNKADGKAT